MAQRTDGKDSLMCQTVRYFNIAWMQILYCDFTVTFPDTQLYSQIKIALLHYFFIKNVAATLPVPARSSLNHLPATLSPSQSAPRPSSALGGNSGYRIEPVSPSQARVGERRGGLVTPELKREKKVKPLYA